MIIVKGRGASSIDAVRDATCDWELLQLLPARTFMKQDADSWLVGVGSDEVTEDELDRDSSVLTYWTIEYAKEQP